ncbi:MAG TPA: exodeoxyribonuclease V subunit gamma, partial [Chitinophagaceae bacterium]|nr:exodeoxyribonuclease V subunit gamma [Chitinophagaceae bacterium]
LESLNNFALAVRHFQQLLQKMNAYEIAMETGKQFGILKELNSDKSVEGLARFENLQELLNSIKEFTETPDEEGELKEKQLGVYLQEITLLTDADQQEEGEEDKVKLMTVHASKGLEFPVVFLVGMEENIFPSSMSMYDRNDLEEERRLFYVAITRAREKLWISYAHNRYRFGSLVSNDPSRFIAELPDELTDQTLARKSLFRSNPKVSSPAERNVVQQRKTSREQSVPLNDIPGFTPDDPSQMQKGMEVEHQRFGKGTILNMEGSAGNKVATIQFTQSGEKKIMLNYAKLRIVRN